MTEVPCLDDQIAAIDDFAKSSGTALQLMPSEAGGWIFNLHDADLIDYICGTPDLLNAMSQLYDLRVGMCLGSSIISSTEELVAWLDSDAAIEAEEGSEQDSLCLYSADGLKALLEKVSRFLSDNYDEEDEEAEEGS